MSNLFAKISCRTVQTFRRNRKLRGFSVDEVCTLPFKILIIHRRTNEMEDNEKIISSPIPYGSSIV